MIVPNSRARKGGKERWRESMEKLVFTFSINVTILMLSHVGVLMIINGGNDDWIKCSFWNFLEMIQLL